MEGYNRLRLLLPSPIRTPQGGSASLRHVCLTQRQTSPRLQLLERLSFSIMLRSPSLRDPNKLLGSSAEP